MLGGGRVFKPAVTPKLSKAAEVSTRERTAVVKFEKRPSPPTEHTCFPVLDASFITGRLRGLESL